MMKKEFKKKNTSVDDAGENEIPIGAEKSANKGWSDESEKEGATCAMGNEVQSVLENFEADFSKVMETKKKHLEHLTNNYMKGSQQRLEQLWNNHYAQRQELTHQLSQQVSSVLQQWESDAQRDEEQEVNLNNLFKQQQMILRQARVVQNKKLKMVRELYEQFVKLMEEAEKSDKAFLQGAQQELSEEMATLQKKILMDTQQQEMAAIRKSFQL